MKHFILDILTNVDDYKFSSFLIFYSFLFSRRFVAVFEMDREKKGYFTKWHIFHLFLIQFKS